VSEPLPILPTHIAQTVRAIAELHADHQRRATPLLRALGRLTTAIARPVTLGCLTAAICAWIALNLALPHLGRSPLDVPPFFAMQSLVSVLALYVTLVILATQQQESRLSENRAQLTLELAILGEQKNAKTIELLEALRRDMPDVRTVMDPEARAMSVPTDPQSMLEALEESRRAAHEDLAIES